MAVTIAAIPNVAAPAAGEPRRAAASGFAAVFDDVALPGAGMPVGEAGEIADPDGTACQAALSAQQSYLPGESFAPPAAATAGHGKRLAIHAGSTPCTALPCILAPIAEQQAGDHGIAPAMPAVSTQEGTERSPDDGPKFGVPTVAVPIAVPPIGGTAPAGSSGGEPTSHAAIGRWFASAASPAETVAAATEIARSSAELAPVVIDASVTKAIVPPAPAVDLRVLPSPAGTAGPAKVAGPDSAPVNMPESSQQRPFIPPVSAGPDKPSAQSGDTPGAASAAVGPGKEAAVPRPSAPHALAPLSQDLPVQRDAAAPPANVAPPVGGTVRLLDQVPAPAAEPRIRPASPDAMPSPPDHPRTVDVDSAVLGRLRIAVAGSVASHLAVHFTAARPDTAARIVTSAAQLDAPVAAAGMRIETLTVATAREPGPGMAGSDPGHGAREHRREPASPMQRPQPSKPARGPFSTADRFA